MARTAVDLFSGSGGVTEGLKKAGWSVVAAVDLDPIAAATYQLNHPEVSFVKADIAKRETIRVLKEAVGGREIDLLVICAPCQPFSSQNRHRGEVGEKEALIIKALAAVRALRPKLVFFENVPGLASVAYRELLHVVEAALLRAGYKLWGPVVEDAANHGVPQRRKRCIMIASRSKARLAAFERTKTSGAASSVRTAIGDLPPLRSGERDKSDPLHFARAHADIAIRRLESIPPDGGSRASLPKQLTLACHLSGKSYPDVYGRMSWGGVAPTLTTGCTDVTRGRFAHPEQNRAISLREAARLQTFGDHYAFAGSAKAIATQIGNAVPPAMVRSLATAFEAAVS